MDSNSIVNKSVSELNGEVEFYLLKANVHLSYAIDSCDDEELKRRYVLVQDDLSKIRGYFNMFISDVVDKE